VTSRLIATARAHWETLDGYAVAHGMPSLNDIEIDRLCNFIYWFICQNRNENEVAKLRTRIWRPPAGVVADARSPWSVENENKALNALKTQIGGV